MGARAALREVKLEGNTNSIHGTHSYLGLWPILLLSLQESGSGFGSGNILVQAK